MAECTELGLLAAGTYFASIALALAAARVFCIDRTALIWLDMDKLVAPAIRKPLVAVFARGTGIASYTQSSHSAALQRQDTGALFCDYLGRVSFFLQFDVFLQWRQPALDGVTLCGDSCVPPPNRLAACKYRHTNRRSNGLEPVLPVSELSTTNHLYSACDKCGCYCL